MLKQEFSPTWDVRQLLVGCENGGTGPYMRYRIPGMVVTKQNTLIMYFEARMAPGDDWADMDILAFRSTDGGETFGEPMVLAAGAASGHTVNNPVMLVGQDGTLHFLYCVEYGVCVECGDAAAPDCPHGVGVFYRKSTDDGLTWSVPQNITYATRPDLRYVFAIGPGHGICTHDGTLVVTVWMVQKADLPPASEQGIRSHHRSSVSTMYSKDNGATWQMGEMVPGVALPDGTFADHNETMCALTSCGGVMLTVRTHDTTRRALAWSPNGYSDWTTLQYHPQLPDIVCMGSVIEYNREEYPYTLLHVNCTQRLENIGRANLVLRGSVDDGKTWNIELVLEPGGAGYSDIAIDQNGTIYVLYEISAGRKCNLVRLKYEDLLSSCKLSESVV